MPGIHSLTLVFLGLLAKAQAAEETPKNSGQRHLSTGKEIFKNILTFVLAGLVSTLNTSTEDRVRMPAHRAMGRVHEMMLMKHLAWHMGCGSRQPS